MTEQLSVDDLLDHDEDELYELLGSALMGEGLGFADEDPERSRAFGKKWFDSRLPEVRSRICGHESVRRLMAAADSKGADDAAVIADLLLGMGDQPTVACVAVIVLRRGLKNLCPEQNV